eukprot:1624324-Pyramimonas_sp.AAC.2
MTEMFRELAMQSQESSMRDGLFRAVLGALATGRRVGGKLRGHSGARAQYPPLPAVLPHVEKPQPADASATRPDVAQ